MFSHLGVAFIFSIVFSRTLNIPLTPPFLLFNIFCNYLPDIDIPIELLMRGRLGGKKHGFHRELTHYPLLYIIISLLLLLIFDYRWILILLAGVYTHFLLDSMGAGWGIKWLWPFSDDRIKLLANQKTGMLSNNFIARWNKKEFLELSKKYGDDNWFRNLYLKPSATLAFEFIVLSTGIIVFFLYK